MPVEPRWLDVQFAIDANQEEVAETGEPFLVLDRNILEGACWRPYNAWSYGGEEDIVLLAVHLLAAIAKTQCFQQGNKRTAYVCAISFLEMNGYRWSIEDDTPVAYWVLDLVNGLMSVEELAEKVRPYVIPV